jgi:hypothetical protein
MRLNMQTLWLILGSLVLPFVWGWMSHGLIVRLWPEKQQLHINRDTHHRSDPLADYQI